MSGMHLSGLTLDAIAAEYIRAHVKHGGHTPKSQHMSDGERLAILGEEFGEVCRALTYDNGNPDKLVAELIQVAAMAAAWVEYAEMIRDGKRNGLGNHPYGKSIKSKTAFGPEGETA
jgi:hypothetical protein